MENVITFRDLGVTVYSQNSFSFHIKEIVLKSNKLLGFVMRSCSKFESFCPLVIMLFNSIVHSNLEYCTVIWSLYYNIHINIVEYIQKKFVNFFLYKFNILVRVVIMTIFLVTLNYHY